MQPYLGNNFKQDYIDSLKKLAQYVDSHPEIDEIASFTWLYEIPWIRDLHKNADKKTVEEQDPGLSEFELSCTQQTALKYNKKSLENYLKKGIKPPKEGKIFKRETFLKEFL